MNNFDVLKMMPLKSFANTVFHMVRYDCKSEEEFEKLLNKEIPDNMENTLKEALQSLQRPNLD